MEFLFLAVISFVMAPRVGVLILKTEDTGIVAECLGVLVLMPRLMAHSITDLCSFMIISKTGFDLVFTYVAFHRV